MKTIDYAQALMRSKGLRTPYALGKYLGLNNQTTLNWFNKGTTFSEEVAERVAEELEIDPAVILADIRAEVAKDPKVRATWERVAQAFRVSSNSQNISIMLSRPFRSMCLKFLAFVRFYRGDILTAAYYL